MLYCYRDVPLSQYFQVPHLIDNTVHTPQHMHTDWIFNSE